MKREWINITLTGKQVLGKRKLQKEEPKPKDEDTCQICGKKIKKGQLVAGIEIGLAKKTPKGNLAIDEDWGKDVGHAKLDRDFIACHFDCLKLKRDGMNWEHSK